MKKKKKAYNPWAVKCAWIEVFKEPPQSLSWKEENGEVTYTFVLYFPAQYNAVAWDVKLKTTTIYIKLCLWH